MSSFYGPWIIALCLLTCPIFYVPGREMRPLQDDSASLRQARVVRHLILGSEVSGTSLDVVAIAASPAPAATRIRLSTPGRERILRSLKDLHGAVRISSFQQALQLVRLRTSRCCCYEWRGMAGAVTEIVDRAHPDEYAATGCPGDHWSREGGPASGVFAVLSPAAYRRGGFGPPVCRERRGLYQISRWVCVFDGPQGLYAGHVQRWVETVGKDGSYTRTVASSMPPPDLPATHWLIPAPK
jgi:hypothetical protein